MFAVCPWRRKCWRLGINVLQRIAHQYLELLASLQERHEERTLADAQRLPGQRCILVLAERNHNVAFAFRAGYFHPSGVRQWLDSTRRAIDADIWAAPLSRRYGR